MAKDHTSRQHPMRMSLDLPQTPPSAGGRAARRSTTRTTLQDFDSIGIREILDQDSRPTFVVDLDPDYEKVDTSVLAPIFGNASLQTHERLWDAVCGQDNNEPDDAARLYAEFESWAISRTPFDESGDIFPSTHVYFGMLWTGSTVRKRWRLISGNHCYTIPDVSMGSLSDGPPAELATGPFTLSTSSRQDTKRRALKRTSSQANPNRYEGESRNGRVPSERDSIVITSQRPRTVRSSEPTHESSYSTAKSTASLSLDFKHSVYDWTIPDIRGTLTEHIEFARAIDWSATPLGAMATWSPELRQIMNLTMKSPTPTALFWGSDLTVVYNEAYRNEVAGRKHPDMMGTGFKGPFAELWDLLSDLFAECARTGNPISMQDQELPLERHGFLEETYFTWSFTPLYGGGKKVLGFYNVPFETTKQVISIRRTQIIHRLGEELSLARTVTDFWRRVLLGLQDFKSDVPVAILYSVGDSDDGESSSLSGSDMSLKSCMLEGTLGIPEGHVAAPARLDLKRSTEGFVPSFREAMRTREPTKLQTRDGSLPESLLQGIEWRGYPEPCREAIIFPVRPTNGENVMAFLLVGVNPRRPYDEAYYSFVNMMNRQLATSLASTILFEDEIRRGQTAAEVAAHEREQLSDQLALQTLRLQRMAETSPVGMYYFDSEGVLIEANDRYFEITGHPRDDMSTFSFKQTIHPDSLDLALASWDKYAVEHAAWSGELRLNQPWVDPVTGEVLETWILASGAPELNPDGSLRCVLGSCTDISQRKFVESLQSRRLKEAEETRRQTNNFLDLTSHEMRNPLSAMIHCADEIQAVLKDVDASKAGSSVVAAHVIHECIEAAETIAHCAQHQKSIVDDILTVSKLDSDLLVITPMTVRPEGVVRQAVKMFDAEVHKKNIACEFIVEESFAALAVDWVLLDSSRILQILINLLTNAIKFQTETERSITVRVGASTALPSLSTLGFEYIPRKNDLASALKSDEWGSGDMLYLQFQVQDTGRGLTKDEKRRLFKRFSQATPLTHAQYGGSGLGLFISRQLTELHGGQIGVGSEAGVGSVFAFYVKARRVAAQSESTSLPLQIKTAKAVEALKDNLPAGLETVAVTTAPKTTTIDYKQLHVLIVEDNIVNQKVLSRQLTKLGCSVQVADHGGLALEHLKKTRFWQGQSDGHELSIILMDLEMPVMDGLTCVKTIRELERQGEIVSHLPVIAVTANVRAELVATAKESGMDDVVSKPFRIPELMTKVNELLSAQTTTTSMIT